MQSLTSERVSGRRGAIRTEPALAVFAESNGWSVWVIEADQDLFSENLHDKLPLAWTDIEVNVNDLLPGAKCQLGAYKGDGQ
jgi:hypothetical protein